MAGLSPPLSSSFIHPKAGVAVPAPTVDMARRSHRSAPRRCSIGVLSFYSSSEGTATYQPPRQTFELKAGWKERLHLEA